MNLKSHVTLPSCQITRLPQNINNVRHMGDNQFMVEGAAVEVISTQEPKYTDGELQVGFMHGNFYLSDLLPEEIMNRKGSLEILVTFTPDD